MSSRIFLIIVMVSILSVGAVGQAAGQEPGQVSEQKGVVCLVVDNSQENFGQKLRQTVEEELSKKFTTHRISLRELPATDVSEAWRMEKNDFADLARQSGANQVAVIEILPARISYQQVLFCEFMKAKATLRIRYYDAQTDQYLLWEDVSGNGDNKTLFPWTSIGTKPAVVEAVHHAADFAAQKIVRTIEVNRHD